MSLDLARYDQLVRDAIATFWSTRSAARQRGELSDVGNRNVVTGGKNLDGFNTLVREVVVANGLPVETVYCSTQSTSSQRHTILPGHYRPTKDWDVAVISRGTLVAAVELKSQIGSLGNNFNNRAEEAIGMGEDLRVAYREGLFGKQSRPFVGYLTLVEDSERSTRSVWATSRHFDVDPVFEGASYAARYDELCRRLVREGLYDAATVLLSSPVDGLNGSYREWATDTGLRSFVTRLAARVAEAAV